VLTPVTGSSDVRGGVVVVAVTTTGQSSRVTIRDVVEVAPDGAERPLLVTVSPRAAAAG